jgi:5-methylcytosine-specific restriction endonuclease McrA
MTVTMTKNAQRRARYAERKAQINEVRRQRYAEDSGYRDRCKASSKAQRDQRTPEQREADAAAIKRWKQENPERVREMQHIAMARYKQRHPERVRAMQKSTDARPERRAARRERKRRLRKENLAAIRAEERDRYRKSPQRRAQIFAAVERREARLRGASVVEDIDRQLVWERDEGICGICGESVDHADFHIDHIKPLALGGEHSYANVQVAHPFCNLSKGMKTMAEIA